MDAAGARALLRVYLGQDETNPDYWTDAYCDTLLDAALPQTADLLRDIDRSFFLTTKATTITSAGVALPTDFVRLETVWLAYQRSKPITQIDASQRETVSTWSAYVMGDTLYIAPALGGTSNIWFDYQQAIAAWPTGLASLPANAHKALVLQAAIEALGAEARAIGSGQTFGELLGQATAQLERTYRKRVRRRERVPVRVVR